MSNKTQLQTNNATLDGYIERINAAKETASTLPEDSISNCTVTITDESGWLYGISYTKQIDGGMSAEILGSNNLSDDITLYNVVCGTGIVLLHNEASSSQGTRLEAVFSTSGSIVPSSSVDGVGCRMTVYTAYSDGNITLTVVEMG